MERTSRAANESRVSPEDYGKVTILVGLSYLIITSDLSIANVALKSIGDGLRIPPEMVSWVVAASALTLAGFLILGGKASDLYGRRNCFLFGMGLFSLGSFLSAFAINIEMLIVTRAVEGFGGAILLPSSFSLINTLLPEGAVRHRAFGTLALMQGFSVAFGLVLGGLVVTNFGWRPGFFINLPIAAAAFILAWRVIPAGRPVSVERPLDFFGAVLICCTITLTIVALSQITVHGLRSFQGSGLLICGVAAFVVFFIYEGHVKNPIMPVLLLRSKGVIGPNLSMICVTGGGIGIFLMVNRFMQTVLGFSATATGLAMVPYAFAAMIGGRAAHFAMGRWPLRAAITGGSIIAIAGSLILFWGVSMGQGYWLGVLPGMSLASFGASIANIVLLPASTTTVPPHQQGVANALFITSNQIGIAVGASVILSVFGNSIAHNTVIHAYGLVFITTSAMTLAGIIILFLVAERLRATLTQSLPFSEK